MLADASSRKLRSIANLIGERGEMAKQPLPRFFSFELRASSRELGAGPFCREDLSEAMEPQILRLRVRKRRGHSAQDDN